MTALPLPLDHPRLRVTQWSEMDRWDPISFHELAWNWPDEVLQPIGSFLKLRKEKVDRATTEFSDLLPVTIHFNGRMSKRNVEGKNYSMELFRAYPGDVVVAKIDLKNGAVALVPAGWENVAVTGHFAVYEIDATRILPKFFIRLIQFEPFRELLWRKKVGAEGRMEVKLDLFLSLLVPLPPLATQQAILDADAAGRAQAAALLAEAAAVEQGSSDELALLLGLPIISPKPPMQKLQIVSWSKLERWSTRAILDPTIFIGTYPTVPLGSVSAVTYGITKDPTNRPGHNARPYLRVANVQRGELDLREVKTIDVSPSEQERYELRNGDILVCEGNSADLVGRPAIWRDEIPHCIHQNHLLRVRTQPDELLPEFLLAYMNCPQARRYFYSRAKYTTNLASINSTDLKALPVPLPPLETQQLFVEAEQQQAGKAVILRQQATQVATEATARVEEMILGNKVG